MLKKALPHILSILTFYAIACVFYSPIVLDGKRLVQGDTEKYIGMSHETLGYESAEGERPAWTDSMFGGDAYNPNYRNGNQHISKNYMGIFKATNVS